MILPMPGMSEEEYKQFKSQFYFKPNPPEIEVKLQQHQERLLLKGDLSVLPEFKKDLAVYARSILLKMTRGQEFIDPLKVDEMADESAENFLKRYFRNDEPAVGASFAGILTFKVREVRARYFKYISLESKMSLDNTWGNDSDENSLSNESILSYKEYLKNENEYTAEDCLNGIIKAVDNECELLTKIEEYPNLDRLFLEYLIYISYLQKGKAEKKLVSVANTALNLVVNSNTEARDYAPILESAFLDLHGPLKVKVKKTTKKKEIA